MKIFLASPRGFCAGVDRAIDIVEIALRQFGAPIYVRHEIVHNRHVVDALRTKGAVFVKELSEVPEGANVIFSAHGVSPAVREEAQKRNLHAIDATCPLVTKVHLEAQRFARKEHEIILIGHAGHVEVEGTMGHAPDRIHLVESVEDVKQLELRDPSHVACITQTTLSIDDTREIMDALRKRFPSFEAPRKDDICYATQNRQDSVKQLARVAELVLVVGDPESSNSNRLVEIAKKAGLAAYLVQNADDIDARWLIGVSQIGVTAGASAPEILVQGVVQRLSDLAHDAVTIDTLGSTEEHVVFQLPPLLRDTHKITNGGGNAST